jgi:hypothetical protein
VSLESVTYLRRNLQGVLVSTTAGVVALRRAVSRPSSPFGQGAQAVIAQTRWHVRADTLAFRPRRGDRVASDADLTLWEVMEAAVETLESRYRCECKLVDDDDSGDVLTDGDGSPLLDGFGQFLGGGG